MSAQSQRCPDCGGQVGEDGRCNSCGQIIEEKIVPSQPCPECGSDNPATSKFCAQCGTALSRYCPQCGASIPINAPICGSCGIRLDDVGASGARCQQCGFQNSEDAEFCAECGARLLIECPQCGVSTRGTLDFCPNCGFDYSRFVAQKVVDQLDTKGGESKQPLYAMGLSSGIMIALVVVSIVIIAYILWQL